MSRWSVSSELQQTNEQTLTTSKQKIGIYLQLLSSPIAKCTEVNLRTWINRRWEWITLSVRSSTVFEENIVVTVLAKLVSLFFKNVHALFSFLTRPLIDRCQIVTDTCIIMFQSLFGSLLNHLYHYANENVSVKHLSLICITSILTTIYSLKNCSVYGRSCRIYSLKSFGLFGNEFRQV